MVKVILIPSNWYKKCDTFFKGGFNMKLYKNKDWLKNQISNKTRKQIAEELEVSPGTISRWAKKFNIKIPNRGNSKHSLDKKYFKKIDTENKAYWLGFIMADGCVFKGCGNSRGNTYRLQVNLSRKDREVLERLKKDLNASYQIKDKKVYNKDTGKYYKASQFRVNCTPLCKDLISLGVVPAKSQIEKVPEIPQKLLRHFFRGYFDGDGYIRKNDFEFISGEKFALDFLEFSKVKGDVETFINSDTQYLIVQKNSELKKIFNLFYDDANIYLKRKYKKFKKTLKI